MDQSGLQSWRFCLYCGISKNTNMKAHVALHHTQQICADAGFDYDSENGVDPGDFFSQLDLVSRVISLLESHRYVLMPACHIWRVMEHEHNSEDLPDNEKDFQYLHFLHEAKEAFRKYRVLFLKGISPPSSYEDLLPVTETTYEDVCWVGTEPPRSNKFSVKDFPGKRLADVDVNNRATNIVQMYTELL